MISDDRLREVAAALVAVDGVVGVMSGGSRARGDHVPESDADLGVYYRPSLDVAALRALARELAGPDAEVTEPGAWGEWVDGGAWLRVDGTAVDWIYRDLDRVHAAWRDARRGRHAWYVQVGHPLGFLDVAYAGEVALGVVLADPSGELTALHRDTRMYPALLARSLVARLGEAELTVGIARKVVDRGDAAYVAGCVFRTVGLCAHALHAHAGRWAITEKGLVAAAGGLHGAPRGFAELAHALLARVGSSPVELTATLDAAEALVAEVRAACAR
ncbi:MAG: hypothetical protein QOF00_2049 [Pseudonocardiales bacterium]|nr:hypothetical protein [Pseudonocardiales bacterium]